MIPFFKFIQAKFLANVNKQCFCLQFSDFLRVNLKLRTICESNLTGLFFFSYLSKDWWLKIWRKNIFLIKNIIEQILQEMQKLELNSESMWYIAIVYIFVHWREILKSVFEIIDETLLEFKKKNLWNDIFIVEIKIEMDGINIRNIRIISITHFYYFNEIHILIFCWWIIQLRLKIFYQFDICIV